MTLAEAMDGCRSTQDFNSVPYRWIKVVRAIHVNRRTAAGRDGYRAAAYKSTTQKVRGSIRRWPRIKRLQTKPV